MTIDARSRRLEQLADERDALRRFRLTSAGPAGLDRPLPPESWEEQRLLAEAHGHPAPAGSPGERFVRSASWAVYTADGGAGYSGESVSVPILAAEELQDYFRAATTTFPEISRTVTDENVLPPWPAGVLDLVTVVPIDNRLVRPLDLIGTEVVGAGVPDGAASPEVTLSSANIADEMAFRWALHTNVDRALLLDDARARRLINQLMTRFWLRQLAHEVLVGDGTTLAARRQLTGINTKAGVLTRAFATSKMVTLTAAVADLEGAGWPGPFVLVGNPVDKKELLDESTWRRDRLPDVAGIVGFDKLAAGTMFLGQWGAANLYSTGVQVLVSQEHSLNFTQGVATVQPEAWVWLDLPNPTAFVKITGM